MRRRVLAAVLLAVLALAGCTATPDEPNVDEGTQTSGPDCDEAGAADERFLVAHGLDQMRPREIVDHLDRLSDEERPSELLASVRPDHLLISDGENEVALDLAEDGFYLSFAPYQETTHDCFFHSLTTCRGELSEEPIGVLIVDETTGEVLVDEVRTTFANGFLGFWLPHDVEGTLTVTHGELTGEVPISTGADSPTCVTTLQLA